MAVLTCLGSLCLKLHAAGWMWCFLHRVHQTLCKFWKIMLHILAVVRQAFREVSMSCRWVCDVLSSGLVRHSLRTTNIQISPSAPPVRYFTKLKSPFMKIWRWTIHNIIGIGYGTWQWILTAILRPNLCLGLSDQKQQHANVCKELCHIASNGATFLSRVMTGDDSQI
jgi:hypothetical protein